jgi:Mg2+-importing ATPase
MSTLTSGVLPKTKHLHAATRPETQAIRVSAIVVESAALDVGGVYARLRTRAAGLTAGEAAARLIEHGPNTLAKDQRPGLLKLLWRAVLNPLVILLGVLATISFATGDSRAASMMLLMIALSVGLKLVQEAQANSAAAKLKAMISVNATVLREGAPQEIAVAHLVPGDVVQLAAGDMIPGDVRIVQAKDLFVIQGSLTGESFPVEKYAAETHAAGPGAELGSTERSPGRSPASSPLELTSIAFLGTSVGSGAATAVVVATGKDTYLGGMAESMQTAPPPTAFDRGVSRFTWLMLRFMAVMHLGRGILLRRRRRRGPDARDAAHDRDRMPLQRRRHDGQEESHREADQLDPEPRRDGRAVHRQDRHAHHGPGRPRTVLRRRAP